MTAVKNLCVYCGASTGNSPYFAAAAQGLGALMAEKGVGLVYGGGRVGMMGVIADAVLRGGGTVTGIIPRHLQAKEVGHDEVTELIIVESMHERKNMMSELADAFAVLPGGLGTLDETFEIITWKQLRLHDKPIVVIDVGGYWQPFEHLLKSIVNNGFAHDDYAKLFTIVPGIDDVFPALAAMPAPRFGTDLDRM
jgi:hypothetical protein